MPSAHTGCRRSSSGLAGWPRSPISRFASGCGWVWLDPKRFSKTPSCFFFRPGLRVWKWWNSRVLSLFCLFFFGAVATHYFAVEEPTFVMAFKCINIFLLAFLNGKRYIRWCCCHGIISKALIQVRSLSQRSPVRWKRLGSCGWWNVMIVFAVTEVSGA